MAHGRRIGRIKLIIPSAETAKKYLSVWDGKELHFHPQTFPNISGSNFFNSDKPINLEIGCGTGEFLISQAQTNSDKLYIGIDSSKRAICYAVDLARKAALDNIHFIFGDFNRMYSYLTPNSIDIAYFHFPDPNYGSKNEKKKIFTTEFLNATLPIFIKKGYLSVVTDQILLIEEFTDVVNINNKFERMHKDNFITSFDPETKSRFHKAWERAARPLYHFKISPK